MLETRLASGNAAKRLRIVHAADEEEEVSEEDEEVEQ